MAERLSTRSLHLRGPCQSDQDRARRQRFYRILQDNRDGSGSSTSGFCIGWDSHTRCRTAGCQCWEATALILEILVSMASRLTVFRNPCVPPYPGLWTRERFRKGKAGRLTYQRFVSDAALDVFNSNQVESFGWRCAVCLGPSRLGEQLGNPA